MIIITSMSLHKCLISRFGCIDTYGWKWNFGGNISSLQTILSSYAHVRTSACYIAGVVLILSHSNVDLWPLFNLDLYWPKAKGQSREFSQATRSPRSQKTLRSGFDEPPNSKSLLCQRPSWISADILFLLLNKSAKSFHSRVSRIELLQLVTE